MGSEPPSARYTPVRYQRRKFMEVAGISRRVGDALDEDPKFGEGGGGSDQG